MKHLSSEKSTLAWFKLAEFVARGEKERALSIFRLLSHSLHNEALVFQLEGDILQSFNDEKAFESYKRAARTYQQNGELVQALTVYEQLDKLYTPSEDVLMALVTLYQKQHATIYAVNSAKKLIDLFLKTGRVHEAHTVITLLQADTLIKAPLHEQFILALLSGITGSCDRPLLYTHIRAALDGYLYAPHTEENQFMLTKFLVALEALDGDAYAYASASIIDVQKDDTKLAA